MKVKVHFNLRTHLWSVTALEGERKGYVIAHETNVYLADCTTKVSEARRQAVIRNKCREVHAWIVGTLSDAPSNLDGYETFSYNPYKAAQFYTANGGWNQAEAVAFVGKSALVLNAK